MLISRTQVGQLDTRIVIEHNVFKVDSISNEQLSDWEEKSIVWAKRMTKGGRLGFENNQQVANNSETYMIRYSESVKDVDASMRLKEEGSENYYYINLVESQKREGWVMINCELKDN